MAQPAQVLVASRGEWAGRSFESVLEGHGYTVRRATSGREALELAQIVPPDVVIIEEPLGDMLAAELCRLLRQDAVFGRAVPVIVTASGTASTRERMAVYAAGAWDYCSQPLDVEVLLLKLETFVDARRSFGELHERSLLDVTTDMYSMRGMRRWSRELLARAIRGHQALACVALAAAEPALGTDLERGIRSRDWRRTADLVASHRRASDVVGHLGNGTFAILAPETDADGVSRLIGRLQRAARQASLSPQAINKEMQLDVGYWAIADLAAVDAAGADPVGQAAEALLHLRRAPNPSAVVSFDEITR